MVKEVVCDFVLRKDEFYADWTGRRITKITTRIIIAQRNEGREVVFKPGLCLCVTVITA